MVWLRKKNSTDYLRWRYQWFHRELVRRETQEQLGNWAEDRYQHLDGIDRQAHSHCFD
jgi:hypothetical protein